MKLVEKYLDEIKNKNLKRKDSDKRVCFLYAERFKKYLLLENSVDLDYGSSDVNVYMLFKDNEPIELDRYSMSDRIEYLKDNIKKISLESDDIANMYYVNLAHFQRIKDEFTGKEYSIGDKVELGKFEVKIGYRNSGIGREMLELVKSATVNNGLHQISGMVVPLDKFQYKQVFDGDFKKNAFIKYFDGKESSLIDKADLYAIYTKLGFSIYNDENNKTNIEMEIRDYKPKFSKAFTDDYKKQKDVVLYR